MKFKIHRGTQEIGGSCVEVWTDKTRIVVDIGMPLVSQNGKEFNFKNYENQNADELIKNGILPDISGLYTPTETAQVDAVLISHYHQDHHGLLSFVDTSIPVFIGKATQDILEFGEQFFNGKTLQNNFQNFTKEQAFQIGDITIQAYWVDHSAFDAYAFLIEANGKRLFYSGDFRKHGRKEKAFKWFMHNVPQNVDYMLMEGTTIGRGQKTFQTETELEQAFFDVFTSKNEITFVNTSAQNIDRLVTIYRACKRAKKLMVVDVYTAAIMKEMAKHGKLPFASSAFPEIKVLFSYYTSNSIANKFGKEFLYQFQPFKITKEEVAERQKDIVLLVRPSMKKDIEVIGNLENGNFIYSMWSGYLSQPSTKAFIDYLTAKGFSFHQVHTSGHADIETLQEMIDAVNPKNLVPIHTFDGDNYQSVFSNVNIKRVQDKEEIFMH